MILEEPRVENNQDFTLKGVLEYVVRKNLPVKKGIGPGEYRHDRPLTDKIDIVKKIEIVLKTPGIRARYGTNFWETVSAAKFLEEFTNDNSVLYEAVDAYNHRLASDVKCVLAAAGFFIEE